MTPQILRKYGPELIDASVYASLGSSQRRAVLRLMRTAELRADAHADSRHLITITFGAIVAWNLIGGRFLLALQFIGAQTVCLAFNLLLAHAIIGFMVWRASAAGVDLDRAFSRAKA